MHNKQLINLFIYFLIILLSIFSLIICNLIILNNYDDNAVYSVAYLGMKDLSFIDAYPFYKTSTGGGEPIFFTLSYIATNFLDMNIFISILNILFLFLMYKTLKFYFNNYKLMYIFSLLVNDYLYVFLSDVHKLKFALIFFMISIVYSRYKIKFLIISILTHVQIAIFSIYMVLLVFFKKISEKKLFIIKRNSLLIIFFISIFILLIFYLFGEIILFKFFYYSTIEIPYRVIILVSLYIGYLLFFNLGSTLKLFYPLAILIFSISFFISPDRVNFILMEFIFFMELNRLLNNKLYALFVIIPLSIYSFYKLTKFLQLGLN